MILETLFNEKYSFRGKTPFYIFVIHINVSGIFGFLMGKSIISMIHLSPNFPAHNELIFCKHYQHPNMDQNRFWANTKLTTVSLLSQGKHVLLGNILSTCQYGSNSVSEPFYRFFNYSGDKNICPKCTFSVLTKHSKQTKNWEVFCLIKKCQLYRAVSFPSGGKDQILIILF